MIEARKIYRLKNAKPLPSGKFIQLRVVTRWMEGDKWLVQSIMPGLYDGARYVVDAAELSTEKNA